MNDKKIHAFRIVSLVAGILVFGVVLYWGGADALKRVVGANPVYLGCVFTATGLITFLGSLRWGVIVNSMEGRKVCSRRYFYYYQIVGKAVGLFASRNVGDLGARPLAMKMSGSLPLGKALYSSFVDKMFDFWLLFLLVIPVLLYLSKLVALNVYLALLLIFVTLGSIVGASKYESLLNFFLRLVETSMRRIATLPVLGGIVSKRILKRLEHVRGRFGGENKIAAQAQLLTLLKYVFMIFRAYGISMALNLNIPLGAMFVAMPIVQASALLSVTLGGLGIQELGWYGALALAGVENSRIVVFLIGQRAYVFLSILILAVLSHTTVLLVSKSYR